MLDTLPASSTSVHVTSALSACLLAFAFLQLPLRLTSQSWRFLESACRCYQLPCLTRWGNAMKLMTPSRNGWIVWRNIFHSRLLKSGLLAISLFFSSSGEELQVLFMSLSFATRWTSECVACGLGVLLFFDLVVFTPQAFIIRQFLLWGIHMWTLMQMYICQLFATLQKENRIERDICSLKKNILQRKKEHGELNLRAH